jgi:hypothetical protein
VCPQPRVNALRVEDVAAGEELNPLPTHDDVATETFLRFWSLVVHLFEKTDGGCSGQLSIFVIEL